MKILVTGGAGFIGSHIVEAQLKKGNEVWVIDNLSTGQQVNLEGFKGIRVDDADLVNWAKLKEAIEWADRIYHAAASLGMQRVMENPIETLENNIESTAVLLRSLAASKKKPQLLLISTSGVYSHHALKYPFDEKLPIQFDSGVYQQECYSLGKFVNEVMALGYSDQGKFPCTIVRVFNTIGPRQTGRYGMVAPRFVRQALKGEPLTVYGDGKQTRSFCNVHDTVRAFDLLLDHKQSSGQIYNVGNNREISILDFAKLVIQRAQSTSTIEFVPYKDVYGFDFVDVQQRCPDLTKLQSLTGYQPKYSLEETIDELIAFYRAHLRLSSR